MAGKMPEELSLSAYLYTLLQADDGGFKEMLAIVNRSVEAVLEEFGLSEKWETKGMERGREEAVRRLQKYGMDPKQISKALELPPGTVFRYLKTE
jgi:DNA-binding NarL/FixJ family response regulator